MDGLLVAVRNGGIQGAELPAGKLHSKDRPGLTKAELVHKAVWKNHIAVLEQYIEDGYPTDSQDEESGWTPLHKALYCGRFTAAGLLLGAGASLQTVDHKGRTPLDLLSADLQPFLGSGVRVVGEMYSWGNGANYQLGSGAVGLQETPVRLDSLHGYSIKAVAAAKFHSAALTQEGQLFTWGFGRGGRLGHGEFHIHSGASAVILPQQVTAFARRQVIKMALAKHHTAAITAAGEIFTWGSNRDGRLGYQATDTQPTPRKINTFNRQRVVDAAVANRHTVALLDDGCVFSWGSNLQGQLGYGTSDSASNATPRIVEAMKGRHITAVAAAKRHTVVLTSEGAVFTWGHRVVIPKRVVLAGSRDISRSSSAATGQARGWEVVFHKGQSEISKPVAELISAGAAHSSAVTADGVVLTWRSMDPALRSQEIGGSLAGKRVVAISAGKYRTAAVTDAGDIYMWEGWSKAAEAVPAKRASASLGTANLEGLPPEWEVPKSSRPQKSGRALAFQLIDPQRVDGLKKMTGVAVGEKHSLALQSWCEAPDLHSGLKVQTSSQNVAQLDGSPLEDRENSSSAKPRSHALTSDKYWTQIEDVARHLSDAPQPELAQLEPFTAAIADDPQSSQTLLQGPQTLQHGAQTLQRLCERCVAVNMVEPRTVLQVLEFADAAGSLALRQHCAAVTLSNLDLIIQESRAQFEQLLPHVLDDLQLQWSHCFPRATGAIAAAGQEADSSSASPHLDRFSSSGASQGTEDRPFRNPREEAEALDRARQERAIRKKLQQIEALEQKAETEALDAQQLAKKALRPVLLSALQALERRRPLKAVRRILEASAGQAAMSPSPGKTGDKGLAGPTRRQGPKKVQDGKRDDSDCPLDQSKASTADVSPPAIESPSAGPRAHGASEIGAVSQLSGEPPVHRIAGFARTSGALPGALTGSTSQQSLVDTPKAASDRVDMQLDRSSDAKGSAAKASSTGKKPARRKGGLSMFLAGQLENSPEPEPRAVTPAQATPRAPLTWAHQLPKSGITTSLRDIQDQEAKSSSSGLATAGPSLTPRRQTSTRASDDIVNAGGKTPASAAKPASKRQSKLAGSATEESSAVSNGMTIALDDLVKKSRPIAVAKPTGAEKKLPAWGNAPPLGASPNAQTRLQDIQAEQEQKRENSARSWGASGASPGSHKSQFLGAAPVWRQSSQTTMSALGTSPSTAFNSGTSPSSRRNLYVASQPQSKWYIKDEPEIVPLRCIQTEESAMKELSDLYGAQGSATSQPAAPPAASAQPQGAASKTHRPRVRRSDSRKSERRRHPKQAAPAEHAPLRAKQSAKS